RGQRPARALRIARMGDAGHVSHLAIRPGDAIAVPRRLSILAAAAVAAGASACDHRTHEPAPVPRRAADVAALTRSVRTLPMTTTAPREVTRTCLAARREATVPVYCPRLVPRGPIGHVKHIADRDLYGPVVFFN